MHEHNTNFPAQVEKLYARLSPCILCPQRCGVDRRIAANGRCRSGMDVVIASYNVHFGEEPPISGSHGSGTIFFTNCNLSCVFCQNYPISQLSNGYQVSNDKLADIMLELQDRSVHNINLVTPTHFVPQIADALVRARARGMKLPVVYNCGGYEDVETLKLLSGLVDIYLPDAKYNDPACAQKYSNAPGYPAINRSALKEMYAQVGDLQMDDDGIARRGLIIRHLVLPGNISGSKEVLEFVATELSPSVFMSIMAQYHPAHRTGQYPELTRKVTQQEYDVIMEIAENLGLENGWRQEL